MCTQTGEGFEIEDLLGHPVEMVEQLRGQLENFHANGLHSHGSRMIPDSKRAGFYEVRTAEFTYYIHVVPGSGKVLLLAAWPTA